MATTVVNGFASNLFVITLYQIWCFGVLVHKIGLEVFIGEGELSKNALQKRQKNKCRISFTLKPGISTIFIILPIKT